MAVVTVNNDRIKSSRESIYNTHKQFDMEQVSNSAREVHDSTRRQSHKHPRNSPAVSECCPYQAAIDNT